MSNVIAVVNHKGGTGKTTTAINLAAGLTRYSDVTSSCLLIDMDPHGCATSTLLGKLDGEPPARSVFDVLRRAITPQDGIASTIYDENIDILPSNPSLESMAKTQITDRLAKVVDSLSTSYGWIIIDTPPNLGVLTQNALVAADYALIPTQCSGLAVPPLHQMKTLIERVQERQNVWLQVMGVLITQKDGRTPAAAAGAPGTGPGLPRRGHLQDRDHQQHQDRGSPGQLPEHLRLRLGMPGREPLSGLDQEGIPQEAPETREAEG